MRTWYYKDKEDIQEERPSSQKIPCKPKETQRWEHVATGNLPLQ